MTMKTLTLASLLVSIFLGKLMLAAPSASAAEPVSARAAFEKLKTLAGEWRGTIDRRGEGDPVAVRYKVTAGGHAVVETLFPGSEHEMVTVYHLDRDRLVLTHYCAAGNQPQMAMTRKSTPDTLDFDFTGGANIKPGKDGHMHALRLHFLGANELKAEWDSFQRGKRTATKTFFATRRQGPPSPGLGTAFPEEIRLEGAKPGRAQGQLRKLAANVPKPLGNSRSRPPMF